MPEPPRPEAFSRLSVAAPQLEELDLRASQLGGDRRVLGAEQPVGVADGGGEKDGLVMLGRLNKGIAEGVAVACLLSSVCFSFLVFFVFFSFCVTRKSFLAPGGVIQALQKSLRILHLGAASLEGSRLSPHSRTMDP